MESGTGIVEQRDLQRRAALNLANHKRSKMAALKKGLQRGDLDPVHLLRRPSIEWEEAVQATTVQTYLQAIRGIGSKTMNEMVVEFGTSGLLKIAALSVERRKELAHLITLVRDG